MTSRREEAEEERESSLDIIIKKRGGGTGLCEQSTEHFGSLYVMPRTNGSGINTYLKKRPFLFASKGIINILKE